MTRHGHLPRKHCPWTHKQESIIKVRGGGGIDPTGLLSAPGVFVYNADFDYSFGELLATYVTKIRHLVSGRIYMLV